MLILFRCSALLCGGNENLVEDGAGNEIENLDEALSGGCLALSLTKTIFGTNIRPSTAVVAMNMSPHQIKYVAI
jgi:hypothetical protein